MGDVEVNFALTLTAEDKMALYGDRGWTATAFVCRGAQLGRRPKVGRKGSSMSLAAAQAVESMGI